MPDIFATFRALVGKKTYSSDSEITPRAGKGGQLMVSHLYPGLYQLAKDGDVHHWATPDEGVAPGTDVAGTAAAIVLHNTSGSGLDLTVYGARLAYESGTLGAGPLYWVRAPNNIDAVPTGTNMLYTSGYMDGRGAPGGIRALYTATIAAADPTIWRIFGRLDASLATTAGIGQNVLVDDMDGGMVVAW